MVQPVFKSKAVWYENSDSNVCLIICSLNYEFINYGLNWYLDIYVLFIYVI